MDASRWWSEKTVAVVTGASKGIGLEVCRQLAEKGLTVVLTARDEKRGLIASQSLSNEGLHHVQFHQLDVQDAQSISLFASWIKEKHGGLDILINNAAISGVIINQEYVKENNMDLMDLMFKEPTSTKGFIIEYESAKTCFDANYYGSKHVTKALLPLLRHSLEGARVINVGSDFGKLKHLQSAKLQEEIGNLNNLSENYIDMLVNNYLDEVKSKTWEHKGWPLKFPNYKMSKMALHAFTRVLAKELEQRPPGHRVYVNCVHPGYVKTDLTNHYGNLTAQEGAENVVRVALFPPQDCPSGQFFYEKKLDNF